MAREHAGQRLRTTDVERIKSVGDGLDQLVGLDLLAKSSSWP
jgi:hypothetical protein